MVEKSMIFKPFLQGAFVCHLKVDYLLKLASHPSRFKIYYCLLYPLERFEDFLVFP
jgi:hypothetical protein